MRGRDLELGSKMQNGNETDREKQNERQRQTDIHVQREGGCVELKALSIVFLHDLVE